MFRLLLSFSSFLMLVHFPTMEVQRVLEDRIKHAASPLHDWKEGEGIASGNKSCSCIIYYVFT